MQSDTEATSGVRNSDRLVAVLLHNRRMHPKHASTKMRHYKLIQKYSEVGTENLRNGKGVKKIRTENMPVFENKNATRTLSKTTQRDPTYTSHMSLTPSHILHKFFTNPCAHEPVDRPLP